MLNAAFLNVNVRPKLKNCLFPAPERPLENVATRNIFLLICYDFFFFLVTGNRDWKFQYCSRIYVRNWFTLLNEQNPLLDFEGTRFVNERSLFWKKKSLYLPTHRWNGVSGVGNEDIFKGGLGCTFVMYSWEKREKMDSYTCNISDLTIVIEIYVQSNLFK